MLGTVVVSYGGPFVTKIGRHVDSILVIYLHTRQYWSHCTSLCDAVDLPTTFIFLVVFVQYTCVCHMVERKCCWLDYKIIPKTYIESLHYNLYAGSTHTYVACMYTVQLTVHFSTMLVFYNAYITFYCPLCHRELTASNECIGYHSTWNMLWSEANTIMYTADHLVITKLIVRTQQLNTN